MQRRVRPRRRSLQAKLRWCYAALSLLEGGVALGVLGAVGGAAVGAALEASGVLADSVELAL